MNEKEIIIDLTKEKKYVGKGKYGSEIPVDFNAPSKKDYLSDLYLGKPGYGVGKKTIVNLEKFKNTPT